MRYLAAAVQYDSRLLDKAFNISQLEAWARRAVEAGARLVVLPEMGTTGYYLSDRAQAEELAEEVPNGPTAQHFIRLARELDCYLVVGLPVREGRRLYNACILVGPEGYWGCHRKVHPYTPDTLWAKNGDQPTAVYDTPIGRLSMQICMDVSFPESVRLSRVKGAQVLCVPTCWNEPVMPSAIWQTRAYENQVAMVVANRHGTEKGFAFSGHSAVLDQSGAALAVQEEGDGIALGEIDTEKAADGGELAPRRPELYAGLQLAQYHWPQDMLHTTYSQPPIPSGGVIRAAAGQFQPERGDIGRNLEQIKELIDRARAGGSTLLVLPELALCGRPESREEAARAAQKEDGPVMEQLAGLAAQAGLTLICGLILQEGEALYNAAVVFAPNGRRLICRKSHLIPSEQIWASAGDTPGGWIDLDGSRIGVLVGSEIWTTELPRLLANDGCDLIAVPADLEKCCIPYPKSKTPDTHCHIGRIRANENNTFVAFSNARGHSGIFNVDMFVEPRREVLAENGTGLVEMEMDTRPMLCQNGGWAPNPVRNKMMLGTRQPVWYDALFELE